jgi:enoyl-CoA hydratase/carnithine racemase
MYDLEVPVIAAVNGFATEARCELALMCDIRIATSDAQLAESFLRVGRWRGVVSATHRRSVSRPTR